MRNLQFFGSRRLDASIPQPRCFSSQNNWAWVVWLNAFRFRSKMNLVCSKVLMVLETLHSRFLNMIFYYLYLLFFILFLQI